MSEDVLAKIEEKLGEYEIRISKLEEFYKTKSPIVKKLSLKEFILQKDLEDDVQRTLAIGYYLEKYLNYQSFNANDIKNCFREAKEKVPLNVADKIQLNIKKGCIMEANEKKDGLKAYNLTNTGEKFVEYGNIGAVK